jgi:hypothetical protein
MIKDFMQPTIVSVRAVDWGIYGEQMPADSDFQIVTGWIHGQIIKETDEFIAIAFQVFDDGGVRHVATIPKVCILERIER